jgi:creatinine amidohydrolase
MIWADLTSAELETMDRSVPVLLSVAAIEQHGPHLPLSTDAVIGQRFLSLIEAQMPDEVLILPQVAVGCSEHHMDFAGSLSVSHRSFALYVGDILRSVLRHGFRSVIVLNSHGGNQAIGQVMLEDLGAAHPDRSLAFLTWWRLAAPELAGIRSSTRGGLGHACEFETSLMMSAAPGTLRADLVPHHDDGRDPAPNWAQEDMLEAGRGVLHRTMRVKSGGDGVVGAPHLATAAKGGAIESAVVAQLAHVIRSLS